jgi:ABC-type transporter Mla MlaB component
VQAERHPAYDNGVLRISQTTSPAGLAIAGEIDEATYPALVTSLHEIADAHQVVHVDLGGVIYCDLAGLRAIVRLAVDEGAAQPRHVRLSNVPQHIRVVLAIIGWDALPGLALEP